MLNNFKLYMCKKQQKKEAAAYLRDSFLKCIII